jgi:alpha-tubulin suppressor-like RCC1 family protein
MALNGSTADENITSGFSIIGGNTNGDFSISSSGVISTVHALDYGTTSSYTLVVIASNAAGDSISVNQAIAINSVPSASDFNMTLDINASVVDANWQTSSLAADADGDTLTATLKTDGDYGRYTISGSSVSYAKIVETNSTDTGILEIKDSMHTIEIAVRINTLYWKQITAGLREHTVVIKSDGTLWAWGDNDSGQLGDGTTTDSSVPVQESSHSTDWSSVDAGYYHTVAMKSNGTVWCWGYNNHGQLGNSSTANSSIPVQESSHSTWNMISAGGFHTAAIKADGTLWSWGNNIEGEMADGTDSNDRLTPTQESSHSIWNMVSAGGFHTAAIKTNGTLWSWGYTGDGQIGNNSVASIHVCLPQQEYSHSTNWVMLIAGGRYTVAMKSDHTLWAWGNNNFGELGNGDFLDRRVPVSVDNNSSDWQAFSTGDRHTIATKTNGELWTWGYNTSGQLGNGETTNRHTPVQEDSVSDDWSSLSAGGMAHSTAIRSNGRLWVWGGNSQGQLGDGSTTDNLIPIEPQPRP